MKLVQMRCPSCGANLNVDSTKTKCFCMFCGAQVLIDDEKRHVVYDNAHQSGWEFEMGRMQAQEAMRQAQIRAQQEAQWQEAMRIEQQRQIDARLTEEAKRNHTLCPRCKSYKTHKTTKTISGIGEIYSDMYCTVCGMRWRRNLLDNIFSP